MSGCRRAAKIRLALDASIAHTTAKPLAENGQENLEQSRNFCRLDRPRYACIPISLVSQETESRMQSLAADKAGTAISGVPRSGAVCRSAAFFVEALGVGGTVVPPYATRLG